MSFQDDNIYYTFRDTTGKWVTTPFVPEIRVKGRVIAGEQHYAETQ